MIIFIFVLLMILLVSAAFIVIFHSVSQAKFLDEHRIFLSTKAHAEYKPQYPSARYMFECDYLFIDNLHILHIRNALRAELKTNAVFEWDFEYSLTNILRKCGLDTTDDAVECWFKYLLSLHIITRADEHRVRYNKNSIKHVLARIKELYTLDELIHSHKKEAHVESNTNTDDIELAMKIIKREIHYDKVVCDVQED